MNKGKERKIKMRKAKTQKGITLIALIITIVVLLILAAVAITAITEYNIIENANSAAQKYGDQANSENTTLGMYNTEIDKYMGGTTGGNGSGEGSGSGTGNSKVGTIFTENGTINGEAYSSTNPIIPAGFKPINTETSKWDDGNLEDDVKNGLVISDEVGNEFVWIPVAYINDMAKVTSGVDANGRTNYEGKLYNFTSTSVTEKSDYGQGTESYREPANLTDSDWGDKADRFTTITWNQNFYQESFNKMVESVAKYKGFYVGRYEMSLDVSGKAQSKAGETSSTAKDSATNMWWGLYEKATTYSNSGVISEMIWGCQWDAIMRWMQGNNIDVTSTSPTDTARGENATYNNTSITGSADSNDILNNIYDLLGNSDEWTQEAFYIYNTRVVRGGRSNYSGPSLRYSEDPPTAAYNHNGSRLTFYVE